MKAQREVEVERDLAHDRAALGTHAKEHARQQQLQSIRGRVQLKRRVPAAVVCLQDTCTTNSTKKSEDIAAAAAATAGTAAGAAWRPCARRCRPPVGAWTEEVREFGMTEL